MGADQDGAHVREGGHRMSAKIEGTVILDGLVEGRMADIAAIEPRLREWRAFVEKAGLRFSLEIDGNSFSLLAENEAVPIAKLSGNPARIVTDALNELLKVFPVADRGGVFSTVRSVEYRKGEEVQTLYSVARDGTIRANERIVEAQTTPPAPPPGWRDKAVVVLVGLAAAVLVLWISSFFIDYRGSWRRFYNSVRPPAVATMKVEAAGFEKWLAVEGPKASQIPGAVTLRLKRLADFPRADADADNALRRAGDTVISRMALEACLRGRISVWYYDKDNGLISFSEKSIAPLRGKEVLDLELPLPTEGRVARIVITS